MNNFTKFAPLWMKFSNISHPTGPPGHWSPWPLIPPLPFLQFNFKKTTSWTSWKFYSITFFFIINICISFNNNDSIWQNLLITTSYDAFPHCVAPSLLATLVTYRFNLLQKNIFSVHDTNSLCKKYFFFIKN